MMSFQPFLRAPLRVHMVLLLGMFLALCLLLAVIAVRGPDPLLAQQPVEFSISGKAVNGTAGGSVPGNLPVALHAIDGLAGRVATYNATTDEEGAFVFEGITPIPGGSYVLVMDFDGMRYSSLLDGDYVEDPALLEVFETTDELAVVKIQRQAMIIADVDRTNREIRALEVLSLENTSDRTLLPELTNITNPADINFLRFSLPEEASELSVQSTLPGGDTIPMGTGFAVTAPVPPGEQQVTYTYKFPYEGDSVTFSQRLIQGADLYQVLAPVSLSQIQVSPLEARPRVDVEGTPYLVWEGRDIPRRQGVVLEFSQLPQPGVATIVWQGISGVDLWLTGIPLVLGLALAALLLYGWLRGQRVAAPLTIDSDEPAQRRRQSLVQAIAVLDDRFERGLVEESDYQQRRSEMMLSLRQATPGAASGE